MALSVSSACNINGMVGRKDYLSRFGYSKCFCCPYGYHIDLDFVRYCVDVAAGSAGQRSTIERRKKNERRRQCQSMEFLLGLISSALPGLAAETPKTPETVLTENALAALPSSSFTTASNVSNLSGLDLSDVVGDFEAILKHSSNYYGCDVQNKQGTSGQGKYVRIYTKRVVCDGDTLLAISIPFALTLWHWFRR